MVSASPKKSQSAGPSQKDNADGEKKKKPAAPKKDAPPAGADIRGFFGGGGASSQPKMKAAPSTSTSTVKAKGVGSDKQPISIDDSDDEAPPAKASKPGPSSIKKEEKPSRINLTDSASPPPSKAPGSKNGSAKKASARKRIDLSDDDDLPPPAKRASLAGPAATGSRGKQISYVEDSDEEMEPVEEKKPAKKEVKKETPVKKGTPAKKGSAAKGKAKGKAKDEDDDYPMDDDDDSEPSDLDDDDEDDDVPKKSKAKAKAAPKKSTPKKGGAANGAVKAKPKAAAKKPPKDENDVKAEDGEGEGAKPAKPKFNYREVMAAKAAVAANRVAGSKEIPEGAPNCLEGLTFVFTGELETLGRDEAAELVKRYSGKVTGAPSKKTSYVVLGSGAGPKKLETIEKFEIKTLDEDGLLNLIRTSDGREMDEKQVKAQEKAQQKILDAAKEMEKQEKEEEIARRRKEKVMEGTGIAVKKEAPAFAQLWTTKYAPKTVKDICGNKTNVERLKTWLDDWQKNFKSGFKKPGKDGMGMYRAILISGPPGIGKTTSAHLMAKEAGYNPIELNASDARSKKLVENSTNIDNASLDGFFAGKGIQSTTVADVRVDQRTCLIMDEVDGMSAGDRGGVGALSALVKKTRIPMILICNDRTLQKMKPLINNTFNMTFRRPQPNEIRSRILSILHKEKLKVPPNVVDELIKGANSDIRQVLNMLSTFKLGKAEMDFDDGKALLKINEKNTIMTPFTIIDKLTSPYAFSRTNKESLNEKSELYFQDFSFVPLFMQEHYIKTNPARISNAADGQERIAKHLEVLSKAADSISDGDLVDRMIHGSEQHWTLLPLHAITSTVAPASFIYGSMRSGAPGVSGWGPSFPQWLGQNSKQGKLQRLLTDIQIRMRLRVSGGRQEIREQYMPMLASKIVLPLVKEGADAIEETISYMDEYYLGKEDWDAFVELGVDDMNGDALMKKISSATKSAFTRQYNKTDHPIAFHKGDMFAASKKKIADTGPAADNEEVFEEDEPIVDDVSVEDDAPDDEVNDVSKDKLIKEVKKKGKEKAAAGGEKKGGKKK